MPANARTEPPTPESAYPAPEHSPGFLLWRTTLIWQRQIKAALAPHELTHVQFVVLAGAWWLQEHHGPPSQAGVAAQAAIDPMMTSQVLRGLEARRLLQRRPSPTDSRARIVTVTKAGQTLLAAALPIVEAADQAFFSPLEDRRDALIADLARLSRPAPSP